MHRRSLLVGVGTGITASIAGCTTAVQWRLSGPDSAISMNVGNFSEEALPVTLSAVRNGEELLDEVRALEHEERFESESWNTPGEYTFSVETDYHSGQESITLSREHLLDCNSHTATVDLKPDGEMAFVITQTLMEC